MWACAILGFPALPRPETGPATPETPRGSSVRGVRPAGGWNPALGRCGAGGPCDLADSGPSSGIFPRDARRGPGSGSGPSELVMDMFEVRSSGTRGPGPTKPRRTRWWVLALVGRGGVLADQRHPLDDPCRSRMPVRAVDPLRTDALWRRRPAGWWSRAAAAHPDRAVSGSCPRFRPAAQGHAARRGCPRPAHRPRRGALETALGRGRPRSLAARWQRCSTRSASWHSASPSG